MIADIHFILFASLLMSLQLAMGMAQKATGLLLLPCGNMKARSFAVEKDSFENPMLWADVPDIDMLRVGDCFYTTMHLMTSAPINIKEGTVYGYEQWATSIQHHKGKFYALFAPNDHPGDYVDVDSFEFKCDSTNE